LAQNQLAKEESIVSGMAGRYAQALFDLAKERGVTDQVAADLSTFSALITESPDLQRFIKSPVFTAEEQVRALTAVLSRTGISGISANFLKLVAAKRRLFAISDMIRDFNKLHDFAKGLARAEVTVAEPLKDPHVEALKTALAELTGGQSVEITVKVDPSIIGGLIVKLGSRMVDGSLKTKLNSIRTRMKEVG
jgi:F-type H+-transporting ATPase subunit delta